MLHSRQDRCSLRPKYAWIMKTAKSQAFSELVQSADSLIETTYQPFFPPQQLYIYRLNDTILTLLFLWICEYGWSQLSQLCVEIFLSFSKFLTPTVFCSVFLLLLLLGVLGSVFFLWGFLWVLWLVGFGGFCLFFPPQGIYKANTEKSPGRNKFVHIGQCINWASTKIWNMMEVSNIWGFFLCRKQTARETWLKAVLVAQGQ